jgi:hypothetical protein
MGYGYRSLPKERKKDNAMEAEFDGNGVELTLFGSDIYHYSKFYLTTEKLQEWHASGKFTADLMWIRSEYVRQALKDAERADNMPHGGPRRWCTDADWLKDVPLQQHIAKLGASVSKRVY